MPSRKTAASLVLQPFLVSSSKRLRGRLRRPKLSYHRIYFSRSRICLGTDESLRSRLLNAFPPFLQRSQAENAVQVEIVVDPEDVRLNGGTKHVVNNSMSRH